MHSYECHMVFDTPYKVYYTYTLVVNDIVIWPVCLLAASL